MKYANLVVCLIVLSGIAWSQQKDAPFVHPLFTDNAVLQRGRPIPVWGWTKPGETVTVKLGDNEATATAEADGKWLAKLPKLTAGGPHKLTISGAGQNVERSNIMIGDVWICSGQSNMEQGVRASKNPEEEVAAANHPNIRLFMVPKRPSTKPKQWVQAQWKVCSPETIGSGGWGGFTAVGYYFGREVHQTQKVPVGLIQTCWGGTIAEAWTSSESLKKMGDFDRALADVERINKVIEAGDYDYERDMKKWWETNDTGATKSWMNAEADDSSWKTMSLPTAWEKAPGMGGFDGIVWFRREITLPDGWEGKAAELGLGPIDDQDSTWVNGKHVGSRNGWRNVRKYKIPADCLKTGKNVIAVRVLDTGGGGGLHGKPDQMYLKSSTGKVALNGDWKYVASAPLAKLAPRPPKIDSNPNVVTVLYNGMISPLLPVSIKGAIWYQGESNAGRAKQYQRLLPTMIADWRRQFAIADFPFFIVQLASFMKLQTRPAEGGWATLREAQEMTARNDPNAGLAVAIDIGEARDIHPKNKQDVGKRLGLAARAIAYGEDIVYSGPWYKSMKVNGNKIEITFDHVGSGLVVKDGDKLKGFDIAGEDKKFHFAQATIEGNKVIVWSDDVAAPVAVRYAWASNPVCNLYNKEGLPAVPFRTDKW